MINYKLYKIYGPYLIDYSMDQVECNDEASSMIISNTA